MKKQNPRLAALLLPPALAVSLAPVLSAPAGPEARHTALRRELATSKARVAIFAEPGFPFYNTSALVSPRNVAASLREAGVQAELLNIDALENPARLSTKYFQGLVLPYGNTFPQEAFANMRAFHRAGGSLILSGVPFTHPVIRLGAQGWSPSPPWSDSVRVVAQPHTGKVALELKGPASDWVGVATARRPIRPGQTVSVSAWAQAVSGTQSTQKRAGETGDWVYARFFNSAGTFLSQAGAPITDGAQWHPIAATVTAPAGAATFDIAPQVRSSGHVVRVDDIAAHVDGRSITLKNASFETKGRDWSDLGHSDTAALFGPGGIGVGGFSNPPQGKVTLAPGDFLGLAALRRSWPEDPDLQPIDVAALPQDIEVKPLVLEGNHPVAALLIHNGGAFKGAVDAWTNVPRTDDTTPFFTEQVVARVAIASLVQQKRISAALQKGAFAKLAQRPRPRVYANLTLPTPPRPYKTFQPKMPAPARHLYVADVRALRPEEQMLMVSLQGIVNRKQPHIYLIFRDEDPFWLETMQQMGQTDAPIRIANPLSLVQTFRSEIRGAVIPDPKIYTSPNLAVSIAALDDVVVATPALAARLKLPIKSDLRGRFKDNAAALRFARTKLLPRANPYISICLDPPLLGNGSVDQIIAARGLCFWITGPKQQDLPGAGMGAEVEEFKQMLAAMPLGSVVRGFWWHGDGQGLDEGPGVSLASRFGKVTVVSDFVRNFSVLSGVPKASLQQPKQNPTPVLDPSKVYIAFTMSDGDNLTTWPGYFRGYFQDPLHGTIPVGWGMSPSLLEVAPTIAQWFYDHATPNDEFICDVSGVGYIYPPDWATALKDREGAFRTFYGQTQAAMARMDMKTIRLMNVRTPDIPHVGSLLPQVPFLMPDYGWSGPQKYAEFTYTLPSGQPVFRAALEGQGQGPREKAEKLRQRAGSARPAFLNAFIWNWGSKLSDLKEMLEILGPEYVAVTPSQLNDLYRQAQARQAITAAPKTIE
jgi:hypothetical protein